MSTATFLVVDDDPSIRTMFARSLAGLGTVDVAEGGKQAVAHLANQRYDAILLDLHMPGMDGFAVLEGLAKEDAINRDTPVFVVTGDNTEQSRLRALKLRSLLLLTKPIPLAMLRSLIETSLRKATNRPSPLPPRGAKKS